MTQLFDTANATNLAKLQGTFTGILAGQASQNGEALAPTSIWNQAGYYAVQDPNTGYVNLEKLMDDSLYTKNWVDQSTGLKFDFTEGGSGITSLNSDSASSSSSYSNVDDMLSDYQYGSGYQTSATKAAKSSATNTSNGTTSGTNSQTNSETVTDSEGNPITLTAKDIKELVDSGVYSSNYEALTMTLANGYEVSDDEQKKLGIYSKDDEEKIAVMMDKYHLNRAGAIDELGGLIQPQATVEEMYSNLIQSGFSKDEAQKYLKELGYKVPKENTVEYSANDEAKILALMTSTDCSREEAIDALGVKPKSSGGFWNWLKNLFS